MVNAPHEVVTPLPQRGRPTDVQRALRHSRLRTTLETYVQTLETYVHWWPKKTRRRNVVGTALRDAAASRDMAGNDSDQT
jgi:hypothetical protein